VSSERTTLTPPLVAQRYGISPQKVLSWIKSGELRAVNVATHRGGRPRWVIAVMDLLAFEESRRVCNVNLVRRRTRKAMAGITEYF
jgi:predicted site-specific integrase-resolvase